MKTARPLTTQATGSRLRSRRLAARLLLLLHVDLPGQWGEEKQRNREQDGRGAAWRPRSVGSVHCMCELDVVVATTACFAQLCLALPCEGLGKKSTESHGSALPSSLLVSLSYGTHSAAVATCTCNRIVRSESCYTSSPRLCMFRLGQTPAAAAERHRKPS